jgi:hypothetical protein
MPNTCPAPTSRPSRWKLILLTAAVMLAHWAVLRAAPLALAAHDSHDTGSSWTFATRTIAPPDATEPAVRAMNQRLAVPERKRAIVRAAPARAPEIAAGTDENPVTPPEKYEPGAAIEAEAPVPPIEAAAVEAPTLLAAATPAPTPSAVATLPAAKAVRSFAFPPSARLKYEVNGEIKGFPYHVNGELLWVQDGKTYNARMEISHFLLGSRVQTSTGQLGAQGLEPTRFGDKVRSEVAAHFDRDKNRVTFSANTPDAPLLPGAQDQLSVFMQMAAMLGGDATAIPRAGTLSFQAVGPRSSETWVFSVGVLGKLVLPGGDISALRLWRDATGEFDPKTEIWLAPSLGYLPVRIRLTQPNGDFVDQQWRSTQKP